MENLFQHIIPVNEGYDYLFSDLVYVPIYETSLLVTKRTIMPISLVEEKVLQLIDVGVYQIDEIAQILGLSNFSSRSLYRSLSSRLFLNMIHSFLLSFPL